MTADNIRFGFGRLAMVAAWIVAIPWLIILVGESVSAFQAADWKWDSFKWSAILIVPVCKLVSWSVKIVGWVMAGFFNPGPEPPLEQQTFRVLAQDKAMLFNGWLLVCWPLLWVSDRLMTKTPRLDKSIRSFTRESQISGSIYHSRIRRKELLIRERR